MLTSMEGTTRVKQLMECEIILERNVYEKSTKKRDINDFGNIFYCN